MKFKIDVDKRYKEPQILSPPEELSACYPRVRAGNVDERRYDYNNFINIFQPEQSNTNHQFPPQFRDLLLFTGTIQKTAESAEARRENNTSLRLSASSAVNLFYHNLFIQNKLKSHPISGVCT